MASRKKATPRTRTAKALPPPDNPVGSLAEIGDTGLKRWSGTIDEEFVPQLRGSRATRVYADMRDNDATVGAVLFAIEMLMRQVTWRVEPVSQNPVDREAADFVESCRNDMSETWTDTVAQLLSFLQFGYSLHEEVYKIRRGASNDPRLNSRFEDGRIGWRKLPPRSQDSIVRWEFDERIGGGELAGAWQQAPPIYAETFLPSPRLLHFRSSAAKNNPEGRSILRSAYKAWFRKSRIETIEGIGIERDLAGLPTALVPASLLGKNPNATDAALRATIEGLVRNIRRDEKEGILFPLAYDEQGHELYKLTLLSTGGRRQFDTSAVVTRYDQRITMSVLADFILLGMAKVGSFALASSKTDLFAVAIGAWLDVVTDTFNRVAIPRLFALNAFAVDELPRLVHGDIESVDLAELGTFITQLAGAGAPIFPDVALENKLREMAGLPPAPEDRDPNAGGLTEDDVAALAAAAAKKIAAQDEAERAAAGKPPRIPPEPEPDDDDDDDE